MTKHIVLMVIMLLTGCKNIYMTNMVGNGEEVNVSEFVYKYHYKPIYCGNELCQLINPSPQKLSNKEFDSIIENINSYIYRCNLHYKMDTFFLIENIRYVYTYFITYYPVDVYMLDLDKDNIKLHMEIRKERGVLLLPDIADKSRWNIILK